MAHSHPIGRQRTGRQAPVGSGLVVHPELKVMEACILFVDVDQVLFATMKVGLLGAMILASSKISSRTPRLVYSREGEYWQQSSPVIVYVFPDPVCPYANMVTA